MKFLLDDNIPYSIKKFLDEKGIEAYKLFEIGLKGEDDEKIYEYALKNGFAIITLDTDFGYIFFRFRKGTIIVLRPEKAIPQKIRNLLESSLKVIQSEEGLIIVMPNKIRVIKP